MKTILKSKYLIFAFLAIGILNSCVEDDFDTPPVICNDGNLTANKTIEDILNVATDAPVQYTGEDVIEGYVTSNDQAGNFFSIIHLQNADGTRGFSVPIGQTDLYTIYSPGTKVLVKLNGLYVQNDFDALEVGGLFVDDDGDQSVGRLASGVFKNFVLKTCSDPVAEDDLVNKISISDVSDQYLNTLVEFDNVQFEDFAVGKKLYEQTLDLGNATNYDILDTNGNRLIFRTSRFADFAETIVPETSGTIRGVLTKFRDDYQLIVRSLDDLALGNDRLRPGFASSVSGTQISIADARAKYTGSDTSVTDEEYIEGIITMTGIDENNISNRNAFIQDDSGAIAIRLSSEGTMLSGDQVKINLKDNLLSEFRGLLQINATQNEDIELVADDVALPDAKVISVAELLTGNFESQLVQVEAVQFEAETGTFSGGQNITDCSNTVSVFTSGSATFADDALPTGNGSIIGIASEFNVPQLVLRNAEGAAGLTAERCEVTGILTDISAVRALFTGADTDITDGLKIKGIVISDRTTGSVTGRNLFLQDATGGIVVRFDADHSFDLGSEIEVVVQGSTLSEFNGLLQVSALLSNGTNLGAGTLPNPIVITISQLLSGDFESQLVQIDDVQFETENGTFSGSNTITDCTDSFGTFTGNSATFADTTYPTGNGSIIGIASEFNTPQLTLRDANDAVGLTGTRCITTPSGTTSTKIFFSELADPNNNANARYIEIYNSDSENLDLTGWTIRRYTNGNADPSSNVIDLTSQTINAGQAFVIAAQSDAFETAFGFAPDMAVGTGGPADSNGDDNIELVDPFGTVIDVFGVPGEDGTGTNHEFEDGRANRKASVTEGNSTYTFAEWDVWNDSGDAGTTNEPQDAPGNFTPGVR